MPAPEISGFGDGDHGIGETGLTIDGGGFGAFPGSAWIYENANRSGATDQLTIGAWNDIELSSVDIPGAPNNNVGTRYLFVQREDLAWSQSFSFTLSVSSALLLRHNDTSIQHNDTTLRHLRSTLGHKSGTLQHNS